MPTSDSRLAWPVAPLKAVVALVGVVTAWRSWLSSDNADRSPCKGPPFFVVAS